MEEKELRVYWQKIGLDYPSEDVQFRLRQNQRVLESLEDSLEVEEDSETQPEREYSQSVAQLIEASQRLDDDLHNDYQSEECSKTDMEEEYSQEAYSQSNYEPTESSQMQTEEDYSQSNH